jgi:CrcB protein
MVIFLWVCAGGVVGTGIRHLISRWTTRTIGAAFPYAALTADICGAFVVGTLMHIGLTIDFVLQAVRIALATGVLGGFATYAAFNNETRRQLQEKGWLLGVPTIVLTAAACLAAGMGGLLGARWVLGG